MQRQGSRHIQHLVHICFCRLRHAPSRIGGQCIQIASRTLGIKYAQSERGFAGAGHTGNADNFPEGNVHIYIFQVVDPRAADQYLVFHVRSSFQNEVW